MQNLSEMGEPRDGGLAGMFLWTGAIEFMMDHNEQNLLQPK